MAVAEEADEMMIPQASKALSSGHGWIRELPVLGAGIGFREPFRGQLFLNQSKVDFLEITADHFFDTTTAKELELELLAEHFVLIPHGLNLSLGSAEGLDQGYVGKFSRLVNRLQPPWWSEHIAFTRAGGLEIGHLTPMPFTRAAIRSLCRNIAEVRDRIGPRLILENITFNVTMPDAEMNEAQFLSEVIGRTGCGLLLDVTNLHANSVNHRYDPIEFLDAIPMEKVVQLHFVGGHEVGGRMIDSHSEPTPPEVWQLLEEVVKRAPVKGVILERDDNLPPFGELAGEVGRAREILWRCSGNTPTM